MNDWELLDRYVREGSHEAFAALVQRHLNLVYSAARRQMGSPGAAEDVAQLVFIALARKAPVLKPDGPLAGWLYAVTRTTALETMRREARLARRTRVAAELFEMNAPSDWSHVEPLLDEAVSALDRHDRTAIVLRFFENKSLRDVGGALGTSEDAAQKRVSRAIEQLRIFFVRRGVPVSAAALASDLSANAIESAPGALGASITGAVLASGAAGLGTTASILSIMSTGKHLSTAVIAVAAGLGLVYFSAEYRAWQGAPVPVAANAKTRSEQRSEAAQRRVDDLNGALAAATARADAAAKALASANPGDADLPKPPTPFTRNRRAQFGFDYGETLAKLNLPSEIATQVVDVFSDLEYRTFSAGQQTFQFSEFDPALTRAAIEFATADDRTALRALLGEDALRAILEDRYGANLIGARDFVWQLNNTTFTEKLSEEQSIALGNVIAKAAPRYAPAETDTRARIQQARFQTSNFVELTPEIIGEAAAFLSPAQVQNLRARMEMQRRNMDTLQATANSKAQAVAGVGP